MSVRTVLLLTILVGFAVTFGVMWQDREEAKSPPMVADSAAAIEPQLAPPASHSVFPAVALSPKVPDAANVDPRTFPAAQLPPAARDTANTDGGPPPDSGSSAPVEAALPVQIRFRNINNIIEATLFNVSDAELTVDVSVKSRTQPTSQTTLRLPPRIPTVFGIRDGLDLHSADEVTLRGDSYGELVTTVH